MDTVLYLVCDSSTGEFIGFYNDNEVVDSLMSSRDNLIALGVYNQLRDELLTRNFKVNISSLPSSDITIDSMEYITFTLDVEPDDIRLANIKAAICNEIDIIAEDSIKNGTIVDIKGKQINFKFSHGNQYRLKELIDNYKPGDTVYYSPDSGFEIAFDYTDIKRAYISLFNNKSYIYIYSDVVRRWIQENLTIELYDSKEEIYTYGYVNDDILEEVNSRYERLKLRE